MRYSKRQLETAARTAVDTGVNAIRKPDMAAAYVLPENRSSHRINGEPFAAAEFEKCTQMGWTAEAFSEWLRWSKVTSIGRISPFDDPPSMEAWRERFAPYHLSDAEPAEAGAELIRAEARSILEKYGQADLLQNFPTFWQKLLRVWRHGLASRWLSHPACMCYEEVMAEAEALRKEGIECH